jgi:hypothetical protein
VEVPEGGAQFWPKHLTITQGCCSYATQIHSPQQAQCYVVRRWTLSAVKRSVGMFLLRANFQKSIDFTLSFDETALLREVQNEHHP